MERISLVQPGYRNSFLENSKFNDESGKTYTKPILKHILEKTTLDKMNRRNFEDVSSGSAIFKSLLIKFSRRSAWEHGFDQSRTINFEDVSSGSAIFKDRFIKILVKRERSGAKQFSIAWV